MPSHRQAEEENVADAQFNLACYYASGIGMQIDEVTNSLSHSHI
jgi:TPR repeat protein